MTTPNNEQTPATPAAPGTPEAPAAPATPAAPEAPAAPEGQAPEGEQKPTPEDELPDWAKKELGKVREEAAKYRTRLRDAETKLSEAKTPEDFENAVRELREENARLNRSVLVATVAAKYELPAELAAVLQGDNEAALEEHAKTLQKFAAPGTPETLGGGLTPDSDDDGEMDPRKLARRTRRR